MQRKLRRRIVPVSNIRHVHPRERKSSSCFNRMLRLPCDVAHLDSSLATRWVPHVSRCWRRGRYVFHFQLTGGPCLKFHLDFPNLGAPCLPVLETCEVCFPLP